MSSQTKAVQTLNLDGEKPNREKKCSEIVDQKYKERLEEFKNAQDFFKLCPEIMDANELKSYNQEKEQYNGYSDFFDYANQAGLSFDRVEAETFKDQEEPYWRWQLCWGGPSQEFRLFDDGNLEFWHLDWFDGACVIVQDEIFKDLMNKFKSLSIDL